MKKAFFFLCMILSANLFAQSPWVVNETFPETKLKWLIKNDNDYTSTVSPNGYDVQVKSKNEIHIFGEFAIHNNIDFLIEVSFTALHQKGDVGCGIIFGCNSTEKQDGYSFQIGRNGGYTVKTLTGVDIIAPRLSKYVNVGDNAVNKLKVMQLKGQWLFWINDNQVDFTTSHIIFGENAGFIVGSGGHASFTSLKVYDLSAANKMLTKKVEPWYAVKFYDNFNDNKNEWDVKDDDTKKLYFDNGYVFKHKNEFNATINDHSLIDASNDYVVELEAEHIDGLIDAPFGLEWGMKDQDNRFEFKITADGFFKITKTEDPKDVVVLINYTETKYVKQGNNISNILTVKKIDDTWFFYINDHQVYTCPAQKVFGDQIGMFVYDVQTVKAHSLKGAKLMYNY